MTKFHLIKQFTIYSGCTKTAVFRQNLEAKSKLVVKTIGAEIYVHGKLVIQLIWNYLVSWKTDVCRSKFAYAFQ